MEEKGELKEQKEVLSIRDMEREERSSLISVRVVEDPIARKRSFMVTDEFQGETTKRRSLRGLGSDVVPVKSEKDVESISFEPNSTNSDSLTPDFPPIIVVIDSESEDPTNTDFKTSPVRISKMCYGKPNMELKMIPDIENASILTENILYSNEIKTSAFDNALDILKKFNFENYVMQNYTAQAKSISSSYECLDVFNDMRKESSSDSERRDYFDNREMNSYETINLSDIKSVDSNENETFLKIPKNISSNFNDITSSLAKEVKTNKGIMDYAISDGKKENAINETIQIKTLLLDTLFYKNKDSRNIYNQIKEEKNVLQVEESKELLINKIMSKTKDNDQTSMNLNLSKKNSKSNFSRGCRNNTKNIQDNIKNYHYIKNKNISFKSPNTEFSKNGANIQSLKPLHNLLSILSNSIKPVSTYKVPWEKLVLNGDVIIIQKEIIININDVVDAIGSTIILRDLGLLMLPERILICKAIEIIKLKSEMLRILISKKFPILQAYNMEEIVNSNQNLCKAIYQKEIINVRCVSKSKRKLNIFHSVLSINGLLKSSSPFPKSTKLGTKITYMKKMFWRFQSQSIYNEIIKINLDSLKRCVKEHLIV